jgi:ribose transport system substrate-binding protein
MRCSRAMARRALALAGLLLLAGCGPSAPDTRPPLIAVVMKSLANGFFVTMAEGATADQRAHPDRYRLILNGTRNESDLAQQVAIIDQMIARHVRAIVIAPADSKAVVPALARAEAAGIAVVNIDNRLDPAVMQDYGIHIPFVGPDNREGARLVGEATAAKLREGDPVAILEGIPTADNSRARRMGLEDAAHGANLKIVSEQSASWDQTKAAGLAAALLSRYPDLKAILCANDSMALGAASAVEQAGKAKSVLVSGFDNIAAIRPLVLNGTVVATVDQHADLLAVYGIDYALDAIRSDAAQPDKKTQVDLVGPAQLGPAQLRQQD